MDDMEVIVFENLPSKTTPINSENLNKMQQNAAKAIKNRKPTVELLTVSSTAPLTCAKGDKYYNTTTSKIYTAIAKNMWATTGENPSSLYLYADLEHKELYYYDGTDFKSYGSGKKEIGYADEQLEGTEVILIEDSDFDGENSVELAKVEQNLTSNSENTVPSVKAVNDGIKTNIITGQEVATNEYVDGKRVYLKRIEFTLPTTLGTWESIAQLDNTVDTIIYKELRFKVNNEEYDIPYSYNNEAISCYFNTNTKRLYINQNYGYPKGKSGWGILKYTKNI